MGCYSVSYSQLEFTKVVRLIAVMTTRSGTSYQAPALRYVEFPDHPFEWRQTTFKAADVFKLLHLLAVLGIREFRAECDPKDKLKGATDSERFSPGTLLLIEVGVVCVTVLLRFLMSVCGHRKQQWCVSTVMVMVYMFAPAMSLAVAEYCQGATLTLDFPRMSSMWVVGFIASRALEHHTIQKYDGWKTKIEGGLDNTWFVTTNWTVIFCYWGIQELCVLWFSHPLPRGACVLLYCMAMMLGLLFMHRCGFSKQSIVERCLRRYLFTVKVGLVGHAAAAPNDDKAGEKMAEHIKEKMALAIVSSVLWSVSFLLQSRIQRVPWEICLPLSVVAWLVLLFSLRTVLSMGRNVVTNAGNNHCWFNQVLLREFKSNTWFWKRMLGPEPELFLLCFTHKEIQTANKKNYQDLRERNIEYKPHPMAIEVGKAVEEVGENKSGLFFPEFALKVVYGLVLFFKAQRVIIFYGGWCTQLKEVTHQFYEKVTPIASYLASATAGYLCDLWNCTACTKLEDKIQEDLGSLLKCLDWSKGLALGGFILLVYVLLRYALFRLITWAVRKYSMQFIAFGCLWLAMILSWHVLFTVCPREEQLSNAGLEVCKQKLLNLEKEKEECQNLVRVVGRVVPKLLHSHAPHGSVSEEWNSTGVCLINNCPGVDSCGKASRENTNLIAQVIEDTGASIGRRFDTFNIPQATGRLQSLGRLQAEAQKCVQTEAYSNTSLIEVPEASMESAEKTLFSLELWGNVFYSDLRKCYDGLVMGATETENFWNCVPFPDLLSRKRYSP